MNKTGRSGRSARRTRAQWSALIEQYGQSEQTQTAFCSARGLAISSFTKALRRERENGVAVEHTRAFVPVLVDGAAEHAQSPAWDVELTLGKGTVLRIRSV